MPQTSNNPERLQLVGLMSGTSMDGVDAVLLRFHGFSPRPSFELLAAVTRTYPPALRQTLLASAAGAVSSPGDLARLSLRVAKVFAAAAGDAVAKSGLELGDVDAIASHGQTIAHHPGKPTLTVQIGEAAVIAELTAVTTIYDFRSADTAAGGEGAPLVPYVHHLLCSDGQRSRAIQNIGGMGNVSFLDAGGDLSEVCGSDTGPGNVLIDECVAVLSQGRRSLDRGGRMAARGRVDERLVSRVLESPFFRRHLPASTGREDFGVALARELVGLGRRYRLDDFSIVASATMATARSISHSYRRMGRESVDEVFVCGGGANNPTLLGMIAAQLSGSRVATTAELGLDPGYLEAEAFALLGWLTIHAVAANVPAVTRASGTRVLGKIAPGKNFRGLCLA